MKKFVKFEFSIYGAGRWWICHLCSSTHQMWNR